MAKYSFEFKRKVVLEYISGKGSYDDLASKHGMPSSSPLKRWVKTYENQGANGLMRSRKREIYSFDFKLYVVKLYLTTEVSYQELATCVGMNNSTLITKWVNDFRVAGPDALKPKRKGRRSKMSKSKDINHSIIETINTSSEYLKQLEEENLKLRIENAYLKELRRLRLEGTPQNKKRESSTASEDTSN